MKKYYKLIIWVLIIGYLCFTPGNEFRQVKINIPHFDKFVHFTMFFILALLVQSINYKSNALKIKILVASVFYAGIIEVIQANYIYMRSGDIVDFIFDVLGLFIGLFSLKYLPKFAQTLLK